MNEAVKNHSGIKKHGLSSRLFYGSILVGIFQLFMFLPSAAFGVGYTYIIASLIAVHLYLYYRYWRRYQTFKVTNVETMFDFPFFLLFSFSIPFFAFAILVFFQLLPESYIASLINQNMDHLQHLKTSEFYNVWPAHDLTTKRSALVVYGWGLAYVLTVIQIALGIPLVWRTSTAYAYVYKKMKKVSGIYYNLIYLIALYVLYRLFILAGQSYGFSPVLYTWPNGNTDLIYRVTSLQLILGSLMHFNSGIVLSFLAPSVLGFFRCVFNDLFKFANKEEHL